MSSPHIFRYFKTSPGIIRLTVMMYVCYPLSLRNVEDLLHERSIDITHETVHFWWNRFGQIFHEHSIEHRLTRSKYPWTNGQVERINRTIKEAMVKRYHYDSHDQLRIHPGNFVDA